MKRTKPRCTLHKLAEPQIGVHIHLEQVVRHPVELHEPHLQVAVESLCAVDVVPKPRHEAVDMAHTPVDVVVSTACVRHDRGAGFNEEIFF